MGDTLREFESMLLLAVGHLEEEAYGLAIHEHIESVTGRSIAIGQIYTGLARLESNGLVSFELAETTGGRRGRPRKLYRVEPAGVRALERARDTYRQLVRHLESGLPGLAKG